MKVLIFIKDLSFEAIIGILPKERQKEQKINLSVKIKYHYSDFGGYINYAEVADTIMKCVKTKHYGLLEEALKDIAVTCFNFFHGIISITLSIEKPDILKNCRVGVKAKFTRSSLYLY